MTTIIGIHINYLLFAGGPSGICLRLNASLMYSGFEKYLGKGLLKSPQDDLQMIVFIRYRVLGSIILRTLFEDVELIHQCLLKNAFRNH